MKSPREKPKEQNPAGLQDDIRSLISFSVKSVFTNSLSLTVYLTQGTTGVHVR